MIKTINKEYQEKDKKLSKLKAEMLNLLTQVNVKALTAIEQGILMLLIEEKEK